MESCIKEINMRRLIIADVKSVNNNGKSSGHYFSLAENYLELFRDVADVKIGGGPIYKTRFKEEDLFTLPHDCKNGEPKWKQVWHTLLNCRYLYHHTNKDDIIVMQHSAAATFMIGIMLFARKKNNIYVITYDKNSISNTFKRMVYSFAKKYIKGFITSNEDVAKAFQRPYCIVPDYIFSGNVDKLPNISYKDKKYDFVMVGSIWPDKGVLEAAQHLANTPYKVLIAGGPAFGWLGDEIKAVCDKADNIDLHLGFVSDEDFKNYIDNARYSLLNYQGTYAERSSGVVLDALFRGVPVVGHHSHANFLVEEKKLGYIYDKIEDFDPSSVIDDTVYNKYHQNVIAFLKGNTEYKESVIHFLELNQA